MITILIKGMSCQHCVASVTKALEDIPEVTNVIVNLKNGEALYDGNVDVSKVKEAIAKIGFEVIG